MKQSKLLFTLASVLIVASMILGACATQAEEPADEGLAVGIVLPTKDEPRWIQDETRFKDALTEKGYAVEILFSQAILLKRSKTLRP